MCICFPAAPLLLLFLSNAVYFLIHNLIPLPNYSRYLNMESRFSHLRQRDTSVSMLRVKMSRRRSQSLKENRERSVNTRRQLHKLQELEMSCLDASIAAANMSTIQENTQNEPRPVQSMALISIRLTTRAVLHTVQEDA